VPILTLVATFAVLMGLVLGFAFRRSADDGAGLITPLTSAIPSVPPTLIPTLFTEVAQEATLPVSETAASWLPTPTSQSFYGGSVTYGTSVDGRSLLAYRLGTGSMVRAIIGGIHGGYEWNTVVLVSETLKYLQDNPALVPDRVMLYVIPCANPDGYAAGTDREHGRVNSNGVDLNRNWDYDWQPTATHGTRPVDAGAYPFSEPETAALRNFILEQDIEAAIFYHSALARVFYGAEMGKSASYELAQAVSQATGYPIADGVPGQITTGDAVDWMSDQGLAGIEVELATHENIEWDRNLQGLLTFLNWAPSSSETPIVETTKIGTSVQGHPIEVTQVGDGDQVALVIIGSIHGDEANTESLVRGLMVQYASEPELVPPQFSLYFVPAMNPDGLAAGTRHNANNVDLNRNWPTEDWQANAARTRGIVPGSGGTAPGSEPEVQAVSRWLLDVVKPSVQEVWLLSNHSAYQPSDAVQPGYTAYGIPGPQAERLAQGVVDVSSYTYLPTWTSEYTFTGELIHWCDVNGIWAADVELPSYDSPDVVSGGKSEPTLVTHRHVLETLLTILNPGVPMTSEDGYIRYVVRPGDSLLGIAFQFEGEVEAALRLKEAIMRVNGIDNENFIREGDVLRIPPVGEDQP
jgi:murein tripeptide amidase MpaA